MSFWEGRATARVATAGLTAGLLVLAGLALWSSVSAQATTAHVRQLNETSERWSRVLEHINVADNALRDLQAKRTEQTVQPLQNSVGTARGELEWLSANGTPSDATAAAKLLPFYDQTTDILRKVIASGDPLQADQAELAHSSLRRQISSTIGTKRLDTTEYLRAADEQNARLRIAQIVAFVLDAFLVALFGMVLLGHRRKILRQAAKNEHEAHHDALTGLANRTLLARRMDQAVLKARKKDEPLALLIVDLDRFKEVNDSLGHHCGDLLLRQVANRLSWAVRDTDLVARLGGDEFAVLLPGVGSAENARMVADKILSALAMPVTLEGLELEIAGSVGVALCPSDSGDGHELLRHADIAMYAAKREKSGVAVYDARLHERGAAHLTAVTELRHAIDRNELFLHYQPKALADTGAVCGVEALARWQHPTRGLVRPDEFIPIAEENGLIEPLTRYVIDAALRQCRVWQDAGWEVPVSVNVGAACLHHTEFPGDVADLIKRHGLPARLLTLEITESAIISDPDRAVEVLRGLTELGVRLSIDDFGTGYSSISYLRNMRVHEMKLDRSFVTHMCTDAGDSAIVHALVALARNFGLQAVAEGVEDQDTWTALAEAGCDVVQGYFLSEPLPAEEVVSWLGDRAAAHA
ncbi:putative bifunctional diguanylate cyclase/phosphodiesterase [Lentzea aerocolonigenes]|uniref:putative bifunctional diguanylate cyclase/phosphodiesterase n=1 Tax=Lentzea aerocolonigenes TaxID=68170 RepID=UPI00068A6097|nr:bifunctional diguanylate cyclase/phosphodiesterase [Lentzea aerocolonigenes]MCP2245422.1 diguanylate cyclase (GGDEF) domain-containing protein [Lentzea aerocolonigenes]